MAATGGRNSDHGVILGSSRGVTIDWSADAVQLVPEPWMRDAVCATTDPELFFPDKGGTTRYAKKVCANCDVVEQCLRYALENDERFGVWGGQSERQRRRLRSGQPVTLRPRVHHVDEVHSRWLDDDQAQLERLYRQGRSDTQIAELMGRHVSMVAKYRRPLGPALGRPGRQAE